MPMYIVTVHIIDNTQLTNRYMYDLQTLSTTFTGTL